MNVVISKDSLEKSGVIDFFFTNAPKGKSWDQTVHVFFVKEWEGKPKETEEMRPQWFEFDKVPLGLMWEDDPHWLPLVIRGKKIRAKFTFRKDNSSVINKNVKVVDNL